MQIINDRLSSSHEYPYRFDYLGQRYWRHSSPVAQRDMAGLCNVSLPFLNQVDQGKPTAQIGKVLEVCRRHGIEVIFHLPAKPDGEGK
jgi:HTH-type transcriptional regulator / antitoxin HipB